MASQFVCLAQAFRHYALNEGSETLLWISAGAALALSLAAVENWRRRISTVRGRLRVLGKLLLLYTLSAAVIVAGAWSWDQHRRRQYEASLHSPPKTLYCRVTPSFELRASLKASDFTVQTDVSAIPASVRSAFVKTAHEGQVGMAQPGARWQATDMIAERGLPRFRLSSVALSKSLCILFYEEGGFGWSFHTDVLQTTPAGAEIIWSAYSSKIIDGPSELIDLINGGNLAVE